jgi:hypothetical protein
MGQDKAGKPWLGRSFALPVASLYRWSPCTHYYVMDLRYVMSNLTPFEVF